jgi:hypothetical protein
MPVPDTAIPATDDAGPSTEATTTTNEDTQETDAAADLENDDTTFDVDDDNDAEETDESDESTDDEAATESNDDDTEESTDDVEESDATEDSTASEDGGKPKSAEEAFKQRQAQRQANEAEIQKSYDQYLNDSKDDTDRALREVRLEAYIGKIERNTSKIETGLDKAVAAIPELTKGSPEFKEALNDAYLEFLESKVTWDQHKQPVEIKGDVLQYLQAKADSFRKLTAVGARQQTTSKSKQKSRTDVVPSRSPKPAKKDEIMDGFDAEVAKWS